MERDEFTRKHPQKLLDVALVCLNKQDKNKAHNNKKKENTEEQ